MNYFTPELIARYGSADDAVARAAEKEWEETLERYNRHVEAILPRAPGGVAGLDGLLLHDARVESMSRHGSQLVVVLAKQIPPRDVVILAYDLLGEPVIDKEALPPEERSPVMEFLYDELDLVETDGQTICAQEILFSNGWELRLRFRDLRVTLAEPIYPVPALSASLSAAG